MTHASYIRAKARQMRTERGLPLDEIAERLALPRTTIYYWLRDLPTLGQTEKRSKARERASRANSEKYRRLREAAYASGAQEYPGLRLDPLFRDFVCLYIAEGYKRNRNIVAIANSDAAVLLASLPWMRRFAHNPLRFSLQYHADQDLDELRAYWGCELGIDGTSISLQRKSNSNQLAGRTWRSAHGVLTIAAGDTYFRARLQAWIDGLRAEWLTVDRPERPS